jgi:hypothetical protein
MPDRADKSADRPGERTGEGFLKRLFKAGKPDAEAFGAGRHASLPEWAAAMESVERVNRFERLIAADLVRRGISCRFDDGTVRTQATSDGEGWHSSGLGLANIGQVCAASAESEWPAVIKSHFDSQERSHREMDELLGADYSAVKSRLRVRLWEHGVISDSIKEHTTQADLPGLDTALVMDLPSAVASINTTMVKRWGIPPEQLFARAIDNTYSEVKPDIQRMSLPNAGKLLVAQANSYYTSSLILAIDRFPDLIGPHGSLISVPVRHLFLSYPIHSADVLTAMKSMILVTHGLFRDGPGSVSNRVYWYNAGRWREIPVATENDRMSVIPPPDFVEMVREFPDAGEHMPD